MLCLKTSKAIRLLLISSGLEWSQRQIAVTPWRTRRGMLSHFHSSFFFLFLFLLRCIDLMRSFLANANLFSYQILPKVDEGHYLISLMSWVFIFFLASLRAAVPGHCLVVSWKQKHPKTAVDRDLGGGVLGGTLWKQWLGWNGSLTLLYLAWWWPKHLVCVCEPIIFQGKLTCLEEAVQVITHSAACITGAAILFSALVLFPKWFFTQ